jgi:NAD(P)-dependent dehydrogenase (short-subunit alcohol dehydrogenase family)
MPKNHLTTHNKVAIVTGAGTGIGKEVTLALLRDGYRFIPGMEIDELSVEQWQAVVDINLTGSFLCAREAFRMMKTQDPRGGRIINNGSISAHAPRPNSVPYTATKHAITGLTKSLSLDGRRYDIACGQIDIGNPRTARVYHRGGPPRPSSAGWSCRRPCFSRWPMVR